MNDQRSLTEQLKTLLELATLQGLYDAADWLRNQLDEMQRVRRGNPK